MRQIMGLNLNIKKIKEQRPQVLDRKAGRSSRYVKLITCTLYVNVALSSYQIIDLEYFKCIHVLNVIISITYNVYYMDVYIDSL